MSDSQTVTPSTAELWVAYLRKSIVSLSPVLLALVLVLSDAVNSGAGLNGVTWVTAALAAAQAAGTYLPANAVAKLAASLAAAIGSGIVAGITDGRFTTGEILIITVQLLTWAGAGVLENGAQPAVARAHLGVTSTATS